MASIPSGCGSFPPGTAVAAYAVGCMRQPGKDLRKAVLIAGAAVILAGVAFLLLLSPLLRRSLESSALEMFGTRLAFDRFKVDPLHAAISIAGLKLYNPPGFAPDQVMISAPRIEVDFELWEYLVHHRAHFKRCVIEVGAFNYLRKADGSSNFDPFMKYAQVDLSGANGPGASGQSSPGDFQIDELNLTLGLVSVTDASNPALGTFSTDLGIRDRVFRGVDSASKLTQVTLAEVLPALFSGATSPAAAPAAAPQADGGAGAFP